MYCKNCGNEINNEAYVCPKCGYLVATPPSDVIDEKKVRYVEKENINRAFFLTEKIIAGAAVTLLCIGIFLAIFANANGVVPAELGTFTNGYDTFFSGEVFTYFLPHYYALMSATIILGITILMALIAVVFSGISLSRKQSNLFFLTLPLLIVSIIGTTLSALIIA